MRTPVAVPVRGESDQPTPASLSPREWEWLRLAALGGTADAIGQDMGIHPQSAKMHGQHVRDKLGVQSTIDALRAVGWLRVPPVDCYAVWREGDDLYIQVPRS